jgi:hypothetical protein
VVGFLVDDLTAAVRELEAVGVELLGGQVDERRSRMAPFSRCTGCGEPARFSHLLGAWTD